MMLQIDPKRIVAQGYDRIGQRYAEQASQSRAESRARYESELMERLPGGAQVLDLGCGTGVPTTRRLARRFAITGVDISQEQIARARGNIPDASFIHAEMTELDLPPASFDGVSAFFSIIHVPRQEQPGLLHAIARWLRPGGVFVAAMTAKDKESDYAKDWLGVPMYWSGFDSETNQRLIHEAGLHIVIAREEIYAGDGVPGRFLWVIAQKAAEPDEEG